MASTPTSASAGLRAIDRLRKAANFEPIRRVIELADGSELDMWIKPLTSAEREKAQRNSKGANDFAIQLLILKAETADGEKMFKPGDAAILRNEVEDEILQKMILAVLRPDENDEDEDLDMKSN